MSAGFDPGPVMEPFASLAREYPGEDVYPSEDFRVEWGPIFHRGRLDGSARIVVLGQDPGAHEAYVRRILVGEAGQRVQGFLRKLGIDSSYAMVNAFVYSVYGQRGGERHWDDEAIAAYRHRWFDALLRGGEVEAVVAFGHLAHRAYERWLETDAGSGSDLAYAPLTHPTMPDAASDGDPAKRAQLMKRMLAQWNEGLDELEAALTHPDREPELVHYGEDLTDADLAPIPEEDLPAGLPAWMRSLTPWADRVGADRETKRATLVVTVPPDERPWNST
jgi:uracil-DNA glycosylase